MSNSHVTFSSWFLERVLQNCCRNIFTHSAQINFHKWLSVQTAFVQDDFKCYIQGVNTCPWKWLKESWESVCYSESSSCQEFSFRETVGDKRTADIKASQLSLDTLLQKREWESQLWVQQFYTWKFITTYISIDSYKEICKMYQNYSWGKVNAGTISLWFYLYEIN